MRKKIAIFLLMVVLISNITIVYSAEDANANSNANSDVISIESADSNIWQTAKDWILYGSNNAGTTGAKADWSSFNDLAGILWGAGIFVVLIAGTILGIKYMFSSMEEKANIKESMRPFIIGTVIIIGALTIWKFAVEILDKVS